MMYSFWVMIGGGWTARMNILNCVFWLRSLVEISPTVLWYREWHCHRWSFLCGYILWRQSLKWSKWTTSCLLLPHCVLIWYVTIEILSTTLYGPCQGQYSFMDCHRGSWGRWSHMRSMMLHGAHELIDRIFIHVIVNGIEMVSNLAICSFLLRLWVCNILGCWHGWTGGQSSQMINWVSHFTIKYQERQRIASEVLTKLVRKTSLAFCMWDSQDAGWSQIHCQHS